MRFHGLITRRSEDEYPENNIDVPKTGDGCKNAYGE
jgi:hypothetical protein